MRQVKYLNQIAHGKLFDELLGGERLRVPVPVGHRNAQPPKESSRTGPIKELAAGDLVQVFDLAHFGFTGKLESVQGDTICVILDKSKSSVCVKVPNIIGLSADTYDARKS